MGHGYTEKLVLVLLGPCLTTLVWKLIWTLLSEISQPGGKKTAAPAAGDKMARKISTAEIGILYIV